MRVDRHLERSALQRTAADRPTAIRRAHRSGDRDDRSEHRDQRRHVVRAHVEERPPAGLVVELGRRMPRLVPRRRPVRGGAHGRADRAGIEKVPRRLHAGAEHGVRCRTDTEAGGIRRSQQFGGLGDVQAERLLGEHVLSGGDRAQPDLDVSRGDRQVQHRVDAIVRKKVVDAERLDVLPDRDGVRALRVDIRDRHELEVRQLRDLSEVLLGDLADADDADPHRSGHGCSFSSAHDRRPSSRGGRARDDERRREVHVEAMQVADEPICCRLRQCMT